MTRTTIVIPCYNEADRLETDRFLDFVGANGRTDLLFVNDGSQDETLEILESLRVAAPDRIHVLDQPRNGGKAEAVRAGMLRAIDRSARGEACYAGFWDADLATPLEAIPEFQEVLTQNPNLSVVMGTRIPLLGRSIDRKPIRRVLGRGFARAASVVLGLNVYDTQCGAKLFRISAPMRAVFGQPFLSKWIFDVEILARMTLLGKQQLLPMIDSAVAELPLWEWTDVDGSKLKGRDFLKAVSELGKICATYRLLADLSWLPEGVEPFEPAIATPRIYPAIPSSNAKAPESQPATDRRAA